MRVLFASTQGAGHFAPLLPVIEACRRGGHEVLVAGPPSLEELVVRAGLPFWPGAAPPDEELGPVWARVPTLSFADAEQLVVGDIFARLNVDAMLPSLEAACAQWRARTSCCATRPSSHRRSWRSAVGSRTRVSRCR